MNSEFELIVHKFDNPITIYPVADVHLGAINHQKDAWEAFVAKILNEKDSYIILNGDLINNNTRSSVGSPFDDVIRPRDQKKMMMDYLTPLRDKILCITSGNHEQRSLKDADNDPTYDIACKLDLEDVYRSNVVFMKVCIGSRNKGNGYMCAKQSYSFAITHGTGGGIYTGATVNRNERWGTIIDNVDCVVVSHTHKGTVTRPAKIVIDSTNNKVSIRDYLVVSSTAWSTYGEYAMRKMMLPSATCNPQQLYLHDNEKYISVKW